MKLNEIKTVAEGDYELTEGVIPVSIMMTLEQVIVAGKVTNPVQTFTIAALVQMFKDGGPTRWPRDLNAYAMCTNSEIVENVKTLKDGEAVEISTWLIEQLKAPVQFETNPYAFVNPQLQVVEWVRWVLSKQA
jgi:hypothetical protein